VKRLLLDTHVWLWYVGASEDLPRSLRDAIDDSLGLLWLSPISLWEAGVLARKKRIRISAAFQEWVTEAMEQLPVREAPINFEIARRVQTIDLPQGDPADHFLATTALVYDLTLITVDQHLAEAPWLPTLTS
jgi:PIN domain nuclease of toxin-antitoxin system